MKFKLLFLLLIISLSAPAQITTDGTLGPQLNLPGPDYQIDADLGQQRGGNLFHSFQNFNLQSFESATFSGPNHIQNVISRVTGGNPSNIDGTIRSTIPNANMYFLNPYGIMFGPNTRLDVLGSFHVSTADYLRLGQGGRFDVRYPNDSILTVTPIESFGFLTDSPAKITTQSSKFLMPSDKTLSFIGGDIHLTSDTPLTVDHSQLIPDIESKSILAAEHGQVNLVSMASEGEVKLTENDVIVQGEGGQIKLDNTRVEMSGYSGGAVFIRAAQLFLDNSIINSNTFSQIEGKNINIKLTEAAYINGSNSEIFIATFNQNNASDISIEVPYLEITGGLIYSGSVTGQAGDIEIQAKQVMLKDGAFIANGAFLAGQTGDIIFKVEDRLSLIGFLPGNRMNHGIKYENARSTIFSISGGAGNSGNIFIDTKHLNLISGIITTDTFGMGQGGKIIINAQQVDLLDGAEISSESFDKGQGGDIKMNIADKLYIASGLTIPFKIVFPFEISGVDGLVGGQISSTSTQAGASGSIDIQANQIIVTDNGQITAKSQATGHAGNVIIQANKLQLTNNGQISTSAEQAVGGNITLTVPGLLYLQEGGITTSVQSGLGDGGNITISQPQFTVLNQGQIVAQADAGNGGNIRIAASQFIKSYESLVSASSRLGLDGNVEIDSPNENVAEGMLTLSSEMVDAGSLMEKTCETMTYQERENRSQFIVQPLAGNPASPYGLQPSRLPKTSSTKQPQQTSRKITTHQPRSMVATTCKPSPVQPKTPVKK